MFKFFKRIQQKWLYSIVGLWTAVKEEKSLWGYLVIAPIIVGLGVWLKFSFTEWAIVVITMFLVFTVEIINTALEAAVDTISFQYNVKVKKIKDIASGATLVITLGAVAVLLIIFIPHLKEVL